MYIAPLSKKKSSCFTIDINGKQTKVYQLEFPFELPISPLKWLEEKKLYPKIFWESKIDSTITLALGSVIAFEDIPDVTTSLRFFGAFSFPDKNPLWQEFSLPIFFLPRVTLSLKDGKTGILSYHYLEEEKELNLEDFLKNNKQTPKPFNPSFFDRTDLPSKAEWNKLVEKALHTFEKTSLQKVVLARASHLNFTKNICPFSIMEHLCITAKNCTLFAYIPSETISFVGASPEHLYRRIEKKLFTEAIAGTRPRGSTQEEDANFIKELYESDKEQEEFNFVNDFLEETLSALCDSLRKKTKTTIIQTKHLQHLYHAFEGILKPYVKDKQLLEIFHPTPAIGGYPKHLARKFIEENEPFPRGLYAAPLGWMSSNSAEFIVAIRSALLNKHTMTLFAGAGIVKNSDPHKEWEELELKISPLLNTQLSYATK